MDSLTPVAMFRQVYKLVDLSGKKCVFFNTIISTVSRQLDRSKRFTLCSPSLGRPVHFYTNSASLGSIIVTQQLREDYSIAFPPLSIAMSSFIHLSEQDRRGEN